VEGLGVSDFWSGRHVLVTGHTGFKGAWLTLWLQARGALVTGLALPPEQDDAAFGAMAPWGDLEDRRVDLRDAAAVAACVREAAPEVVFHLGAQALVRRGWLDPGATYATNVVGTANLLEAVLHVESVRTVLVVTSDKVYENTGRGVPFQESDPLGGSDPYSNSKACAELVVASYRPRLAERSCWAGTARAGNVIGGGDAGEARLVPDVLRAVAAGEAVRIRHPDATRPWQHVVEPLAGYLAYAERATRGDELPAAVNFGPSDPPAPVRVVVETLLGLWGSGEWVHERVREFAEATALQIDASLAARTLGWRTRLTLAEALRMTVAWHKAQDKAADVRALALQQVTDYASAAVA
jgi:CDP-glucose 4,6-dehydratase